MIVCLFSVEESCNKNNVCCYNKHAKLFNQEGVARLDTDGHNATECNDSGLSFCIKSSMWSHLSLTSCPFSVGRKAVILFHGLLEGSLLM